MDNTLSTGKAVKLMDVSAKTLQRWDREGRLIPVVRMDSNQRSVRGMIGNRSTRKAVRTMTAITMQRLT